MKKTYLVLFSLFIGLITVIYLNTLIQSLAVSIITGKQVHYFFNGIILNISIPFSDKTTFLSYGFLLILPLLISLAFIEISSVILKKNSNINFRLGLVFFQIINIGYVVINIFLAIIAVAFRGLLTNKWVSMLDYAGIEFTKQLLLMLLILIVLFVYMNFCANRLKRYLTVIKEK